MKKIKLMVVLFLTMTLSACSFLDEVNNTLDYVNTATEHINTLTAFSEEAPQLVENALTDPAVAQELEEKLLALKSDVEEFIALKDIPAIAEDIHQELVGNNELLLEEINKVLENGHLALDKLENSEIYTTINDAVGLLNRIQNLAE